MIILPVISALKTQYDRFFVLTDRKKQVKNTKQHVFVLFKLIK